MPCPSTVDGVTLNTTDAHPTTEVISDTDIDESDLPVPPKQSVLNSPAPLFQEDTTKQKQSIKTSALKSSFSQYGQSNAIYTILETSEENSRAATPAPPITRQKKILSKTISITVEDRDTGVKEEIFEITLDHQTGQTYNFEENPIDSNEKDIGQELNSPEKQNSKNELDVNTSTKGKAIKNKSIDTVFKCMLWCMQVVKWRTGTFDL